jgi:N-acetyl-anhydromuramyl-L-alanine amidase AmpD
MFARGDREASAHYVVGPDEVIQCVKESDKAWGAGAPVNDFAIHVEHTAFAEFTAEQWASPEADAMLRRSAALVAGICSREGIPVERLDAEALRAHPNGLAGHVDVSRAWHGTDHTDPGKSFPWDHYLALVEQAMTLP